MKGHDGFSRLTVDLPQHLSNQIADIAERTGQSPASIIQQALLHFLLDDRNMNAVYISAPVNALMKGLYEENTSVANLKKHGDFGLGTFNGLDGEMVMIDGQIYQLRDDGCTYGVEDDVQTPFACTTFFKPDIVEEIKGDFDYSAFKPLLDRLLLSKNMLYAMRIDGYFRYVKVWSVSKQENYRPISDVPDAQPSFEYSDVEGTLAGFYTPRFIKTINMPGYHLHFLTKDRKRGGHLHDCRLTAAKISIQLVSRLKMDLPLTLDYLTASLNR